MATRMVRHRYDRLGEATVCGVDIPDGRGYCGLAQFASFHYSDADHPYTDPEGVGLCGWGLQNPDGSEGQLCNRPVEDQAHASAAEEERASEMAGVFRLRPPDEAADARRAETLADVEKTKTWSLGPGSVAGLEGVGAVRPSLGERLAADFVAGEDVRVGPWPLRQWRVGRGEGLPEGVGRVMNGLWSTGAAFDQYVWWMGERRVVRVVWGELLGLDETEIVHYLEGLG